MGRSVAVYRDGQRIVAREMIEKDALAAHVRDELGLSEVRTANPLQAALAWGLTFTVTALNGRLFGVSVWGRGFRPLAG